MAENSKIEWTDHTFNPWIGCTKVSPGCAHCYAEILMDRRYGRVKWGKGKPRQRTSAANWKQPMRWNNEAAKVPYRCLSCGKFTQYEDCVSCECEAEQSRPRVFCASLADWLDDEVPTEWLADLLELIRATPHLDWLLLTKRPQNWRARMEAVVAIARAGSHNGHVLAHQWLRNSHLSDVPHNIWIGTSVEDQARADERIPALLEIPAHVRFLSCEPLLSAVDLTKYYFSSLTGGRYPFPGVSHEHRTQLIHLLDWIICGGESGPNARPMHPMWAYSLRDQCTEAGVPFLFKQWGEWMPAEILGHNRFQVSTPAENPGPRKPNFLHWKDVYPGDENISAKVGKKAAGRELDGREWNEFPRVEEVARA